MKHALFIGLRIAVLAYLGVCAAMFALQRKFIYFPQSRAVTAKESTMTLPVESAELVVTVRPHSGPKAILYFGGNAEDVSLNLASFSAWFPDHAIYLMHYRGYGGSTGSPTEENNHRDAVALFRKVRTQHSEIAVIGRSLGTGVAVRLASEQPVSRLILVTPFDSIVGIAASEFSYLPVGLILLDRYDSSKYAPGIRSPVTIIAAENDEVIPRASTEKLLGRFPAGVASMAVIPAAGHNTVGSSGQYGAILRTALR